MRILMKVNKALETIHGCNVDTLACGKSEIARAGEAVEKSERSRDFRSNATTQQDSTATSVHPNHNIGQQQDGIERNDQPKEEANVYNIFKKRILRPIVARVMGGETGVRLKPWGDFLNIYQLACEEMESMD